MNDAAPGREAVVVPAIGTGSSVTCVRSLGRRGVDPIAVSDRPSPPSFRSKYCRETHRAPSPASDLEGYKRALLSLAERPAVRTIVPLREPDIYVLSKYRDEFAAHVATPWPSFDVVQVAQDRLRLLEAARRVDVRVPRTRPLDEWEDWSDFTVVKPRYSILERGEGTDSATARVVDRDDPPDVEAIASEMGHVPVAQEYVPGDEEHGFFALFDEGEPVVRFQHRRIRSYGYDGGASVYRKSIRVPDLEAAGIRLLRELDWHGPAMVEFKRDPDTREFVLMEVNPRFWGSLALAVAAGVDFPAHYYKLATGTIREQSSRYETGVGCHLLRGEISYLYSLLADDHDHVERPPLAPEAAAMARSILADPTFDFLDPDDARPFAADFGSAAAGALSGVGNYLRRAVPGRGRSS